MQKVAKCGTCCVVFVAVLGVLLQWYLYHPIKEGPLDVANLNLTFSDIMKNGMPRCTHPHLIRNGLNMGACRTDPSDYCVKQATERMIEVFGDMEIPVFHRRDTTFEAYFDKEKERRCTVSEFLTDPSFHDYIIRGYAQLGSAEEYSQLLRGPINQTHPDAEEDRYNVIRNMDGLEYFGSQFFLAHGLHTGTPMHLAWGSNAFLLLSGVKKWIVIHPKYFYTVGCAMNDHNALYGTCKVGGSKFTGTVNKDLGTMDLDDYVRWLQKNNVPENMYAVFTLYPGDILLNCDIWPHAIENLSPTTVAFTYRFRVDFDRMALTWGHLKVIWDSTITSFRSMLFDPDGKDHINFVTTMASHITDLIVGKKYRLDNNPNEKGLKFFKPTKEILAQRKK